jgi:hypothetical protein
MYGLFSGVLAQNTIVFEHPVVDISAMIYPYSGQNTPEKSK